MTHHSLNQHKPRFMTTLLAFTLAPALALAGPSAETAPQDPQGSQERPSASQPSDSQANQNAPADTAGIPSDDSADTMQRPSAWTPSAGSSMDSMRAPIDSSEVQKVFGMDVALVDINSLNSEDAKKLQQSLKESGHYTGEVDGIVGPKTRAALNAVVAQQYALNQRLINQGKITSQIAESVGLDPAGISPVSGVDTGRSLDSRPSAAPKPGQKPSTPSQPIYPEEPSMGSERNANPPAPR